jgi:hypothetical protein
MAQTFNRAKLEQKIAIYEDFVQWLWEIHSISFADYTRQVSRGEWDAPFDLKVLDEESDD